MAEAFARHLGAGVVQPSSAGVFPARIIQPETFAVMNERGIPLDDRPPRSIHFVEGPEVDLILNMAPLPVRGLLNKFDGREIPWPIRDPIGQSIEVYRTVRDQIEQRVAALIEELRRG